MKKIISGGQTGADFGGLAAGAKFGFETGGSMPPGFMTEQGPKPHWAKEFGLVEIGSCGNIVADYVSRTYANVRDSDATIRFASNFDSKGEQCTLRAIKKYDKPYLDVDPSSPPQPFEVAAWLKDKQVEVLNVAGNRESKSPGLGRFVVDFLSQVFQEMGFQPKE